MTAGAELPQAAHAGAIYTLYEGWATRIHRLADGSRQILDFALPGDLVGLPAALLGSSSQKLEAVTTVTLCELDINRLPALIREHPALALSLFKEGALQAERADRRLTSMGRMGAAERIAYLLLDLRHRLLGGVIEEEDSLPFPLHGMQIADAVGLSRVHVMRALKQLKQRRLAMIEGRRLIIPDTKKLAAFCNYSPLPDPPEGHALL